MFIDNKYTNLYFMIISRAALRETNAKIEKHHVIPKSLGGNNSSDNIVKLTLREHFLCHTLLTKMLTGEAKYKMLHAAWRLANTNNRKITSRQYEMLKTQRAEAMTGRKNPGVSNALRGRKVPTSVIAKRVATVSGVKRPSVTKALLGRKNPGVSNALSGRTQPIELVEKRAAALRGKPSGAKGRVQTDDERAMRSLIMKGRPSPRKGTPWSESRRKAQEMAKQRKQNG